jgi:hypothetical protein
MTVALCIERPAHGTRRITTDYYQRRTSEEVFAMANAKPESLELRGICGLCALDGDCEVVNHSTARMMDCEQFQPDPILVCEMVNRSIASRTNEVPHSGSDNHMGLCENCEHRGYCTFPGREGGVWYCEEYE